MEAAAAHRRSQSDAAGSDVVLQDVPQAPGHVRSVSLGSSASQFLQSLKLQDPAALQHSAAPADQFAVPDQHTPAAGGGDPTGTASAAAQEWSGGQQSARSKRTHRGSSNGYSSSDAMQLDVELPEQQPHGFTPLPAVEEHSPLDSERDWDSDSDREGFGPNRRGSRAGGRRGGCNGRSESELMLLDPKRVKRILANRESAARSKERRVNYTMLLEGQLQDLSVETERLSTQLHSLSKQEGKLKNSKAELEQQVCTMQQQLAQAVSENQALVGVLFQLQAAMGLPQALPDCMQASTHYQQSWQAYDYQAPTCTQPVSSPKQRKPRRHSKHQQQQDKHQQQQQQQQPDMWAGSSYAGSVEPDMNDPAAAAAAPVAELPVQLVSKVQAAAAAAGQGRVEAAAAAAAAVSAAPDMSASALPSVGTTEPPSSATSSGRALQVSSKQHQWHTGLHSGGSNSNSNTPAAAPQLQASSTAAAAAAAAFAPAASAAAQPVQCEQTAGAAGLSTATGATAAALLHQLPTPGADAVMGDAEDDITMLGVFLAGEDELDPAAAAATPAADVSTAAPAAAGMQSYAAAGTAGPDAALAAGWPGSAAGSSLPNHCSPQAATAAVVAPEVHAGGRRVFKTSPALSDPAGLDCWGRDDISSSSVGGSLTHSHTPSLTPSGRPCTEPVNGVNPAYARAGGWQQHQYAASGQGGTHTGVSGTAAVSPQPAVSGAAAAGGRALAPEQLTTPHVSPITPVSSRVRTPSATGAAAAAAVGMASAYPADALQANLAHHYHQQQQQQGVGFMLGDAHAAAAGWGRGRHARSASTGCVGGWQGYDQIGLPLGPELALQQQQQQHQQQEHQGASMLAAQLQLQQQQQQHQQQGHALHAGHQAAAAVGTGAGAAPGPVASVAGHHTQGPMPPEIVMGGLGPGQQVCWQRHRRSHSHAAAFMGQYELSMVQEQQLYYSGTVPTVVSHQGQPAKQGPP